MKEKQLLTHTHLRTSLNSSAGSRTAEHTVRWVSVFGAMLLLVSAGGCTTKPIVDECETTPGTVGCACTADEDCAEGLECASDACAAQSEGMQEDDTPSVECVEYCQCVGTTCVAEPGYPFADEAACLSACADFTEPELTCWTMWCTDAAADATLLDHLCSHAWGELGLDECP